MSKKKKREKKKYNPQRSWNSGSKPNEISLEVVNKVNDVISSTLFHSITSGKKQLTFHNIDKLGLHKNGINFLKEALHLHVSSYKLLLVYFADIEGKIEAHSIPLNTPQLGMADLGEFQAKCIRDEASTLPDTFRENLVGYGVAACDNDVFCRNNDHDRLVKMLLDSNAADFDANQVIVPQADEDDVHIIDVKELRKKVALKKRGVDLVLEIMESQAA